MLKNMTIYKIGDTFKYVSTNLITKSFEEKDNAIKYQLNDNEKFFNNIVRAKTEIKDLILCNNFKYFVTLTFNSKFNRFDLKNLRQRINNKIRKLRKKYNLDFKFLLVPEQHKNNAWHFHGVFDNSLDTFMYENKNGFLSCKIFDYFGFNSFSIIENKDRVSSYMTKYITKDFKKREKGTHLFFCSQNLERPKLIDSFVYEDRTLNKSFFDYKSDYCSIRHDKEYHNIKKLLTIQ